MFSILLFILTTTQQLVFNIDSGSESRAATLNIGKLSRFDDTVSATFFINNNLENDITIYGIRSSCSCIKVETKERSISPKDRLKVLVTYNNIGESKLPQILYIYHSQSKKPLKIYITCDP